MRAGEPAQPRDVPQEIVGILADGGTSVAIYVPDSVLIGLTHALERSAAIRTVVASREDEAFAIATGVALAGGTPVVLMEGSGVGYCGLILARAQLMHVGVLIIASHSPALGERYEYHGATRVVAAAVLGGLGIPHVIPRSSDELLVVVEQSLATVRGQRTTVGVLVPPFVLR